MENISIGTNQAIEVGSGIEHVFKEDPSIVTSPATVADPTSVATETIDPNDIPDAHSSCCSPQLRTKLISLYFDNEFLLLIVIAILLAKAYPPIGAEYLKPDITATWIAVIIIFFLAGLSLKTSEFTNAMLNWKYNVLVQVYNFAVVSAIAYGVSRALNSSNIIGKDLADGMVVCSCMPMTISMVVVLTQAANGNEASAIFNAAAGNFVGVFLSPLLILGYLRVTGEIDLVRVFYQLALRVLLPGIVGQVLQRIQYVQSFAAKQKFILKQIQTYVLVFIVYTVFCETFSDDTGSSIGDVFLMILFQLLILLTVMILAWYMLRFLYRNEPKLRVTGIYLCTHKTVAIGIPLITAIYSDSAATASKIGLYTLPLLIWHPLQLIIGTFVAPKLAKFVEREELRLHPTTAKQSSVIQYGDNMEAANETVNNIEEGRT
jgi:solute carrier family 10 (sodium/bile acid cotransporter), member 7